MEEKELAILFVKHSSYPVPDVGNFRLHPVQFRLVINSFL